MDHLQQVKGKERIAELMPRILSQAVDTSGSAFDRTRHLAIKDLMRDILLLLQAVSFVSLL